MHGTMNIKLCDKMYCLITQLHHSCMSTVDVTHNSPQSQTFLNPERSRQDTVCSRPSRHVFVVTTAEVAAVTFVNYEHYYFLPSFP